MSIRRFLPFLSAGLSGIAVFLLASPCDGVAAALNPRGNLIPDQIFTDSFEIPLAGFNDILLKTIATSDPTCPDTGSNRIYARPDAPVRFCYRLENRSNVTLDQHEIVSSSFGVLYQSTLPLAPGASVVIGDPGSPRFFQHRAIDLVRWRTSGAGRHGEENRVVYVDIAPDIALYRFLSTGPATCPPGILPYFPAPTNSGYTALTVAPGALVTHCFRADNTSIGESTSVLTNNVLTDSGFGQLLDTSQSFSNGEIFVVAAEAAATTSTDFDAQWTASDGTDTASGTGHSSLFVTANPACDGVHQSTSYDYVGYISEDFFILANIRLDFQVEATPTSAGAATSLTAHGAITSLFPDGAFGPRRDTRVYLPIPPGIDLARPFQANASVNGGVPITATLDAAARMLVLSTGRVEGAPAQIDVQINTFVASTQTTPIAWTAPKLELDIEGTNGTFSTTRIAPDPNGPPVLETPLCTAP